MRTDDNFRLPVQVNPVDVLVEPTSHNKFLYYQSLIQFERTKLKRNYPR